MPLDLLVNDFKDYVDDSYQALQHVDPTQNTPQVNPINKGDRQNVAKALKNSDEAIIATYGNLVEDMMTYCTIRNDVNGPDGNPLTLPQIRTQIEDKANKTINWVQMT